MAKRLELPSLREIVSGQCEYKRVPSFSKQQTVKYLEHRLSLAGQCKVAPFSSDDIDYIFKSSVGIPGEIHIFAKQHMQNFVIPGRRKKILVSPILNSSLQGVLRGMERMDITANEIARAGKDGNMDINSFTTNQVDLLTQEQEIKANMQVIKVTDGVLGSLLDERA